MNRVRRLWDSHPNLISWALLAAGMVIIVILAARSVGFKAGQWAALIAATVALAGLCVWILSWEDHEEEEDVDVAQVQERQPASPSIQENESSGKRS
jgi:apolipoprotein N-acyltransferase